MALDPRRFLVSNCGSAQNKQAKSQSARKDFFSAINKIGNLEVLNDIGGTSGGKIASGLRALAGISNSVRDQSSGTPTGAGTPGSQPIPTILGIGGAIGGSLDRGADWVLENVGIAEGSVRTVGQLNPDVANTAYGAAKDIFVKVKNGEFTLEAIPGYLQDLQNLDQLAARIFTGSQKPEESTLVCQATPYARSLIGEFAPKQKFLFIVEFEFSKSIDTNNTLADIATHTAHVIKTTTRPNIGFETEDINMYNFRTKVIKKAEYQPMSMTFYDDHLNSSMSFVTAYLKLISPIVNINPEGRAMYEEAGMNFAQSGVQHQSASIRGLADKNIITQINLYHVYDYGRHANVYNFINPKLVNIEMSELDMAASDLTEIRTQFVYDGLYLDLDVPVGELAIEDKTKIGGYPIKPNGSLGDGQSARSLKYAADIAAVDAQFDRL